jgi:hypothetical protein
MTIGALGLARVLLLIGLFILLPLQISNGGLSFDKTWANNAGGKGNGKGQRGSRAGSNGSHSANGSAGTGSAGAVAKGGRFKSLNASLMAFGHASSYLPIGAMAQYSAALSAFDTIDATDDPTAQELAAILVKVANKDELTTETINSIHQLLLSKDMVRQATLDDAASILAPHIDLNADSNAVATATPTLAELLAEQASLMRESEPDQGLGPIY